MQGLPLSALPLPGAVGPKEEGGTPGHPVRHSCSVSEAVSSYPSVTGTVHRPLQPHSLPRWPQMAGGGGVVVAQQVETPRSLSLRTGIRWGARMGGGGAPQQRTDTAGGFQHWNCPLWHCWTLGIRNPRVGWAGPPLKTAGQTHASPPLPPSAVLGCWLHLSSLCPCGHLALLSLHACLLTRTLVT